MSHSVNHCCRLSGLRQRTNRGDSVGSQSLDRRLWYRNHGDTLSDCVKYFQSVAIFRIFSGQMFDNGSDITATKPMLRQIDS